jgi:hypothetical protein
LAESSLWETYSHAEDIAVYTDDHKLHVPEKSQPCCIAVFEEVFAFESVAYDTPFDSGGTNLQPLILPQTFDHMSEPKNFVVLRGKQHAEIQRIRFRVPQKALVRVGDNAFPHNDALGQKSPYLQARRT